MHKIKQLYNPHDNFNMYKFFIALLILCLTAFTNAQKIPRKIWSYWGSGVNSIPFGLQLLASRVQQQCLQKNWTFNLLDQYSAPKYVQQFRIFPFYEAKAHEADLFRMQLLAKYGGFWVDLGVLFTTQMDYYDHLAENKYVKNKFGNSPTVFATYTTFFGSTETGVDTQGNEILLSPGIQVTLMGCVPQAPLIIEALTLFKKIFSYPSFLKIFYLDSLIQKHQIKLQYQRAFGYYLSLNIAFQTVLQLKQRQLDAKYMGKDRKFAVKQYGLWVVDNNQVGAFQLNNFIGWNQQIVAQFAMSTDFDQANKIKPFEGGFSLRRNAIDIWTKAVERKFYHRNVSSSFNYVWYLQKVCPNQLKIFNNSLIHKYLLTNNLAYNQQLRVNFSNIQLPNFDLSEFCHPQQSIQYIILIVFLQRNFLIIQVLLGLIFVYITFKRCKIQMNLIQLAELQYTQVSTEENLDSQLTKNQSDSIEK